MSDFKDIQLKLHQFIKKYYTNELIKGIILFSAFGLLYFLFTLLVEYFLWLAPNIRIILFYAFVLIELVLLGNFIILPIIKLFGLRKRISFEDASVIIGKHFPEVDDKLLNVLQLNQDQHETELLTASIEQKSASLQTIPFRKAINFKNNIKYLKYLLVPIFIWLFTFLSGNNSIFKESLTRVINYQTSYYPPAPFEFTVLNDKLSTVENKNYVLQIRTIGSVIPENVQIHFNNESYLLKDKNLGMFTYEFSNLQEPISFYLEANGVRSKDYKLNVIKSPRITSFEMFLNYPSYTGKSDELIKNTGNTIVPEGTSITWNIKTRATKTLSFLGNENLPFKSNSENYFSITKKIRDNLSYQITTSNDSLKDYEKLNYSIEVIKDEFPKIEVKSDIDSVNRGPIQFAGQISDDYELKKLNLVYFSKDAKGELIELPIKINKSEFDEFYYIFSPKNLDIKKGIAYDMYFEVFDNDGINGSKSTKSKTFSFYNKTKQEITDDLLKEQQENFEELNKTAKSTEKLSKDYQEFTKKLNNKSELNWNDKKEFDQFIKRQRQYQDLLERHTNKLKENLNEQESNSENKTIKEKKEELIKRIREAQELQKKDKLLEELRKMSEKLDKEGMLKKLDKLEQRNKQEKRSSERLLELAKRFFVEKKAAQITMKLDSLSYKQERQANKSTNKVEDQKLLNMKFDDINKDFKELKKQNENLVQPMKFPNTKKKQDDIEGEMNKATEKLENQNKMNNDKDSRPASEINQKQASKNQKSAAKKMKQLSQEMQRSISAMQGESINENMDDLRSILENLLTFSFDQEQLMLSFEGVNTKSSDFPTKLKQQQTLKEYFEHIDDSLYTLSLRVQKLSSNIQKDLTDAHYNIEKSLENIAENRIQRGMSNQQYTMTAANNLANMLSNVLNSLQNPGMGSGKGNSFSLPDIIKKQGEMSQKMRDGIQKEKEQGKGNKKGKEGEGKNGQEEMTGEQYQIYQEQNALKESLKELLEREGMGSKGKIALKQMELLEKQLLNKGFTNEVLQNMLKLEHELLKLDKAVLEKGKDNKRRSKTNKRQFNEPKIPRIKNKKIYFNSEEILNRKPLPFKNRYKIKVKKYFNENSGV